MCGCTPKLPPLVNLYLNYYCTFNYMYCIHLFNLDLYFSEKGRPTLLKENKVGQSKTHLKKTHKKD